MKVLLISYHYPPSKAVGALRARKVAEAFRDHGHAVTVITARLPEDSGSRRLHQPGLEVKAVRSLPNPRFWYLAMKRRLVRPSGESPGGNEEISEGAVAAPVRVPNWKRYLGSVLWTPDDKQGFILSAVAMGMSSIRGVDLIYTTAPPFSAHLAGRLLRAITGKRWAAEFRDPWTDNPWKPEHVRSRGTQAAEKWMERRVLGAADHVIGVSEGILNALGKKIPASRQGKLLLVRNGIDVLEPARPPNGKPFRITHVGSFYHHRDPRPFLRGLAQVVQTHGFGPAHLRVDLVGDCRWFNGISIEAEVSELGLDSLVHFEDWVPHEQAQALVRQSHLLLLLAQEQPVQVPNKLYEYLGVLTPILAFADEAGESARMLRQIGGHFVLTGSDPQSVADALVQAMGLGTAAVQQPRRELLEEWTTGRQMDRLVTTLGG